MSLLVTLKSQVKRALIGEANLDPEVRAAFDWRFVVTIADKMYLVGKTDANTVYYQTPDMEQPEPCYPDQIMGIIDSWTKSKYLRYMICYKRFDNVKLDNLLTIDDALAKKPKTFHDKTFIVGVTSKGKRHKLYRLEQSLKGSAWVKIEGED